MADDGFVRRWSRRKAAACAHAGAAPAQLPPIGREAVATAGDGAPPRTVAATATQADAPAPSLDDALRADPGGDFAAFVARGVAPDVRRAALRVMFTDPHFSVMDGLDVYIGDYTQAAPIPPAMLAALSHAQAILAAAEQTEPSEDADTPDEQ